MHKWLAIFTASLGAGSVGFLLLRDQTTDSDETGEDVGNIEVQKSAGGLGAKAVEILNQLVGQRGMGAHGTPEYHRSLVIDKINLGVYGDGRKLLGKPWCARAVRWAYETAAQQLGLPPPFGGVKSTLAMVSSWKGKPFSGYKIAEPKVGAVLLLGDQHATIIAKVLDDRTIISVEGNHGDSVANVKRTINPSKDTIADIERYVMDSQRDKSRQEARELIVGLGLLGAEASR